LPISNKQISVRGDYGYSKSQLCPPKKSSALKYNAKPKSISGNNNDKPADNAARD